MLEYSIIKTSFKHFINLHTGEKNLKLLEMQN